MILYAYRRLTKAEAAKAIEALGFWFSSNPDRDTCQTERGEVRREHSRGDGGHGTAGAKGQAGAEAQGRLRP